MSLQRKRLPAPAQAHRDGQRIGGNGQVVADDAVEDRDQPVPFRAVGGGQRLGGQQAKAQFQRTADQPGHAVDGAVDKACDAARSSRRHTTDRCADPGDGVVHLLDQPGRFGHAPYGQAAEAVQVGGAQAFGHRIIRHVVIAE